MLQAAPAPPAEAPADRTTSRILDAALKQFETWGLRRSTVEDVARTAGVSRVTVYRRFGNKEGLAEAVLLREETRFFGELYAAVHEIPSPVDRLVEGFTFALAFLRRHTLLNRLLSIEPDEILPYLTIHAGAPLASARRFLAMDLGQVMPEDDAEMVGELLARTLLSFLLTPDTVAGLKTSDDARRWVRRYLAPAFLPGSAT